MHRSFRPVCTPLITVDPFFSVWSFADRLTDDHTRHWTGKRQALFGAISIDGERFRFMGETRISDDRYFTDAPALEQTALEVTPTSTVYTFSHPACELKVTFLTPLLGDRLEVLSRPVSYIFYEITEREPGHSFQVYFDASVEHCGDDHGQKIIFNNDTGHVWLGSQNQSVLSSKGDDVRIDWGYLHLVHPAACVRKHTHRRLWIQNKERAVTPLSNPASYGDYPILSVVSDQKKDVFVLAYDDIHSIRYNELMVDAYYKTVYGSFEEMLALAVKEADELRAACAAFDAEFTAKLAKISPEYVSLGALAYRQAIAAHKLVDVKGELMFLSKENFSNGCIATLDVTYPSIPLFLVINPELVRAMMRPLIYFAKSETWKFPYAPHDCGTYPFCTGQIYGRENGVLGERNQMPIEECGNAILTVAAALRADGDRSLAEQHRGILTQWADYLIEKGYDPENQLCTDDFAGHLAHNCNLSLKAIVALGAFGQMYGEEKYSKVAKDMAARWEKDAKRACGKGWRLTFDRDDTWSLKYNIIWDKLLGLGLFPERVFEEEIDVYLEKMNRYGVPLDSRSDYTKIDWLAWTTVMADRPEYTKAVYESILRMIEESEDRVPLTDWYFTSTARQRGFQARSVLGGIYINLLPELFNK